MNRKNNSINSKKRSKGTVLLVGKNITNTLTKRLLSNRYKIIVAEDGFEALETVRTQNVDLIISKLDLPKMDCLELMMNLKDLNIKSPFVILEDPNGAKEDTSVSTTDIWGYCYTPASKSTMMEALNYIKEDSKQVL